MAWPSGPSHRHRYIAAALNSCVSMHRNEALLEPAPQADRRSSERRATRPREASAEHIAPSAQRRLALQSRRRVGHELFVCLLEKFQSTRRRRASRRRQGRHAEGRWPRHICNAERRCAAHGHGDAASELPHKARRRHTARPRRCHTLATLTLSLLYKIDIETQAARKQRCRRWDTPFILRQENTADWPALISASTAICNTTRHARSASTLRHARLGDSGFTRTAAQVPAAIYSSAVAAGRIYGYWSDAFRWASLGCIAMPFPDAFDIYRRRRLCRASAPRQASAFSYVDEARDIRSASSIIAIYLRRFRSSLYIHIYQHRFLLMPLMSNAAQSLLGAATRRD